MASLSGRSGRIYEPLPIDSSLGFPLSFPLSLDRRTYHFSLYVNASLDQLDPKVDLLELAASRAFLVVKVELDTVDGARRTVFLRKVVPDVEYEAEEISLLFQEQRVSRRNLNGKGALGSVIVGGVARRWA
jgi:hypothetical protein